jgi:tRNA (adenine57-N1/adenine58-N1)-methyltransferase
MDFGRPHRAEVAVASESKICLTEKDEDNEPEAKRDPLDTMLINAANDASMSLFGTSHLQKNPADHAKLRCYTNSYYYPERIVDRSSVIEAGNLVVIFEAFDNLTFVYATPGNVFYNRNGHFYHDDFIGQPFGSKIRSRNNGGLGFVFMLRPTSELWARSLPHRTQIVHELDASMIVFHLHLRPGMVVAESGTGSGAMSHAILRTIAPRGKLHTFEFNRVRADKAREEFHRNKVDNLVHVHHRDVCGGHPNNKDQATAGIPDSGGGFGLGGQAVDAIFLDLPEPWLAVPHAAFTIKPNGRICSYSPCVEQTQQCVTALRDNGFHSMKTVEARLKEYYVDDVELESPPKTRLPRGGSGDGYGDSGLEGDGHKTSESDGGASVLSPYIRRRLPESLANLSEDTGAEADNERSEAETEATDEKAPVVTAIAAPAPTKRKKVCARPFSSMRGHTAFLTFATAGLLPRSNPAETRASSESNGVSD